MNATTRRFFGYFKIAIFALAPWLLLSCAGGVGLNEPRGVTLSPTIGAPAIPPIQKIAVLDFCDTCAGTILNQPHVCPLTGIHFISGSVLAGSGETIADYFRRQLAQKGFTVANDDEVLHATEKYGKKVSVKSAVQIGKVLEADAVLIGSVMRYEERVGGKFSVDKPASIGFSVAIVSVKNGAILWKAKFEKTQKDLLSNLLDARTFFKGGLVWQKADQLSTIGVENIVEALPFGPAAQGDI